MVDVRIDFKGLKKTHRFMTNLPRQLDKQLSKANNDFMEDVKVTAKKLVPVDTGALKVSIKKLPVRKGKNVKKWKLVVEEPYGIYQEEGFTPHRVTIVNSRKLKTPRSYFVRKWTPFMKPALERNYNKYLNMLQVSTKRAIAQSVS